MQSKKEKMGKYNLKPNQIVYCYHIKHQPWYSCHEVNEKGEDRGLLFTIETFLDAMTLGEEASQIGAKIFLKRPTPKPLTSSSRIDFQPR